MRIPALVFALLVLVSSVASAQTARWTLGLDVFVPVYTSLDDKTGTPGPITARLGFDRDTGHVSYLDIVAKCYYPVGPWEPTPGHGAIRDIFQIGLREFALYHESGLLRVERLPDALFCQAL